MDISIKGKQVDVGESLREHVEENLSPAVTKFFDRAMGASVIFSREAHNYRVDISVHARRGMLVQGRGFADEIYNAFDGALDRIVGQLRRYKRRLTDSRKGRGPDDFMPAQQYVIQPESADEEVPEEAQPIIIAEMPAEIATLAVSEAIMNMDLADVSAIMFRNSAHGGLNVVYRRRDGNIGWIDPSDSQDSGE